MIQKLAFFGRLLQPSVSATRSISIYSVRLAPTSTHQLGIIPIDDLKGTKRSTEDHERCKLAALYRLVDLKGWSMNIYNHITLRCSNNPDHFFINPFGLLYSEITASSLLKIDSKCNVVEKGSTTYGLNKAGFTLHSAIHEGRKDINAIIHIHSGLAAGLASLMSGLLPISQEALILNQIGYHDYAGILVDEPMRAQIVNDLGPNNKILALRNHGVVVCGSTLEEAWALLMTFMIAAEIQFYAMAAANGMQNIIVPAKEVLEQVQRVLRMGGVNEKSEDGIVWQFGEMETEADMRRLDRLGYKTGYPYKKNSIKSK